MTISSRPAFTPLAVVTLALAAAISGCGGSSNSSNSLPTAPTPNVVTETFNGSIAQGQTTVFNFTITNSGYTVLAGYTSISPASVTALGLGIGNWDSGTQTCGLNVTQNDSSHSGSTAISGSAGSGNFCVRVYDGGNVPADTTATFTVQVQHY